jgi:hypothetical protein
MLAILLVGALLLGQSLAVRTVVAHGQNCYEFMMATVTWQAARDASRLLYTCGVQGHLLTVSTLEGLMA